ncbi:XRE family transcriptional regulator [Streptomyces sp. NBC_01190]|uniref:XRE family transcriptional regulator n=1 Tax=Streptomyces sp. NBC_01190 TaxID=2903767 RepID=UPI00386B9F68|nr:XRE family transcriptional regulator [Streptomyces sp. NBC_01190]
MNQRTKPGSKSERDALRHEMLTAGFTTVEIAGEMRARFGFRLREALRHAHGWSTQQTADHMNETAAQGPRVLSADASLVGKWEKWPTPGGRRPSDTVLAVMAATYGCAVADLLDVTDVKAMPNGRQALHSVPSAVPENDRRLKRGTKASATPILVEDAPTGTTAVRKAAEESATWAAWAEPTNVGDMALEQIHTDVQRLSAEYLGGDAVSVFVRTRELRDKVFRLLEGHQSPRQSVELYVAAGYLCALLAWMSSDLGHLADADTHGRTAWLCGEKAGHLDLLAWTASTRCKIAFWDGRLRDAIQHARRGVAYAAQGTVTALLAAQEADAWSRLGAADETQNALRRAQAARDVTTGGDEVGGLFACSIGRQEQYHSGAHLRIGMYKSALDEADSALAHLQAQEVRAYGTESQTSISRAMAHVGLGQPEAVSEVLAPVIALRPERRLDTVVGRMRDLTSMIAGAPGGRGGAAVRLRAELMEWCQDSAPARLALNPGGRVP